MTSLHWPHQHFELLSFLAHPNNQRAKKVVSDSPGLVDFAFGLVVFVVNLSDGQVLCFGEIQITKGLWSILLTLVESDTM